MKKKVPKLPKVQLKCIGYGLASHKFNTPTARKAKNIINNAKSRIISSLSTPSTLSIKSTPSILSTLSILSTKSTTEATNES